MYRSKDRLAGGLRSREQYLKSMNNLVNRNKTNNDVENNQNHSNMNSNIYNLNRNSFILKQQDHQKSIFETKCGQNKRIQSIFKTKQNINTQQQIQVQPHKQCQPQRSLQSQLQPQLQPQQQFQSNSSPLPPNPKFNLRPQQQLNQQPHQQSNPQNNFQNPFQNYSQYQQNHTIFGQFLCQKSPGQKLRQLIEKQKRQKQKQKEQKQNNFKLKISEQQVYMSTYDQNITAQIFYQNLQLYNFIEYALVQGNMKIQQIQQKQQFVSPYCKSYKQITSCEKQQNFMEKYQNLQKHLPQKRKQINIIIQKQKLKRLPNFIQINTLKKQRKSIKRKISFDKQIKQQDQYIIYSNKNKNNSSSNNPIYSSFISKHSKRSSHIQTPISEFKISRSQRPITYHYNISFQSYDLISQKDIKNILKEYKLKQKYQGEIKFQKCVDYQQVRNAIEKQVLQKYTEIVQMYTKYTKQRYFQSQIHLKIVKFNRVSSLLKSECEGKFMLPLILELSKGFNYCYDQYDGKIVKKLIIFNQYAQILFLNDINFGKQPKNRKLKNKIIITQTGINIKSQIFNNSTIQITFFRKFKLYTDQQIHIIHKSSSILPLQIDPQCFNKEVDCIYPYRIFGYYQNFRINREKIYTYQQNYQERNRFQDQMTEVMEQLIDMMVKTGQGTFDYMAKIFGMKMK